MPQLLTLSVILRCAPKASLVGRTPFHTIPVMPAKAGIHISRGGWIPACAGMTAGEA